MIMILAVAAGGALGSVLRYLFAKAVNEWTGAGFPYGTLGVNVIGCFVAGLCFVWLIERDAAQEWRALIMVGVLGGFTTFSAFSVDALRLWEQSGAMLASANVLASVAASIAACGAGIWIARHLA